MQRERQDSVKEAAARNVRANPMPVQTKPAPVAHSSRELTGSVHCTCAQYLLDGIMHTIIRNWIFKYSNFAGNNHELNNIFPLTEFKEFKLQSLVRHSSDLAAQAKLINENDEIDAQVILSVLCHYITVCSKIAIFSVSRICSSGSEYDSVKKLQTVTTPLIEFNIPFSYY
jgi:hypothetical protein